MQIWSPGHEDRVFSWVLGPGTCIYREIEGFKEFEIDLERG